jgi:serine/threonine protein kinase
MLGAARGLAFLHTGLPSPIIHGNLKSKNILVDDSYVAHLSDYGLEKLMIPAATNDVVTAASAQGYKAPELIKLKKANTKTDIYSFGIVLLEVLTGKKPGRSAETDEVVDLPTLVKSAVLEEKTTDVFDFEIMRGLARTPADDGLLQALQLAMGCCAPTAAVRPDIGEVIRQLEEIRPKVLSSMQSPVYTPDTASTRSRDGFDF